MTTTVDWCPEQWATESAHSLARNDNYGAGAPSNDDGGGYGDGMWFGQGDGDGEKSMLQDIDYGGLWIEVPYVTWRSFDGHLINIFLRSVL